LACRIEIAMQALPLLAAHRVHIPAPVNHSLEQQSHLCKMPVLNCCQRAAERRDSERTRYTPLKNLTSP
jgi:hypothetical protein